MSPQFGRRDFVRGAMALGVSGALGALMGCRIEGNEPQSPLIYRPDQPVPWINWAGNQFCRPGHRFSPATLDELVGALQSAPGVVRAVGAGHSFSALVPTDDTLIATDLLSGLVNHDAERQQATLLAGTRLHDVGPLLAGVGQALPNMPDMDYPALAGSIATSVHGTGTAFGSMSSYVSGLTLVSAGGEVLSCDATHNSELFQAARTSVGALGIVADITLQNQPAFQLTEESRVEVLEEVLEDIDQRCTAHRHFECFAVPYSTLCVTVATDLAQPGDVSSGADDPEAVNTLRSLFNGVSWLPLVGESLYDRLLQLAMRDEPPVVRTGPSYQVLPHVRQTRFREMEYTVPAESGPACLREILAAIKDQRLPLSFPIEYRYVKADDTWLSMFEGRDGCSISVHQYGDVDYRPVFDVIEPIFWQYEGRPHWGKIHTLTARQLAPLYPHWQDFQALRRELDPRGRFMNAHLKSLFGEV